MADRVVAPRNVWGSIAHAARELGCWPNSLYPYIEWCNGEWHLKPLDEDAYADWHWRVWERAVSLKDRARRRSA